MVVNRKSYPAPPGWEPKDAEIVPYESGRTAFLAGTLVTDNPLSGDAAAAWEIGWFAESCRDTRDNFYGAGLGGGKSGIWTK